MRDEKHFDSSYFLPSAYPTLQMQEITNLVSGFHREIKAKSPEIQL
jgi:hypothetical protein